jgi:hypothetical protein
MNQPSYNFREFNFQPTVEVPNKDADKALALEAQGYEIWLKTIFPFAFTKPMSKFHHEFFKLWWSILMRIKRNEPIPAKDLVIFCLWGRALAKSWVGKVSSLMKAAIIGQTYSVYLCETFNQAAEHVSTIRWFILNDQSNLRKYYPNLDIDPQGAEHYGLKGADAKGLLITVDGTAFRAFGLKTSSRGIGLGNRRPDDFNIDDVDNILNSIAVCLSIEQNITRNFLMTQDVVDRVPVTVKVLQNLIMEHGFVNRLYTHKSEALAERTVIGVYNTYEKLDIATYQDEGGASRHKILPTSIPTWEAVTLQTAQKLLDILGLEAFMAECQNDFSMLKTGKILNFDEKRHVISWEMFEKVFGSKHIPQHWQAAVGNDVGYTDNSISAYVFKAVSAENTPLPRHHFVYRVRTFVCEGVEKAAMSLWQDMFPDVQEGRYHFEASTAFHEYPTLLNKLRAIPRLEPYLRNYEYNPIKLGYDITDVDAMKYAKERFNSQIKVWLMSHEASSEQKTMVNEYGLPSEKTKTFGKKDGIAEWNVLLDGDYTLPHPFKPDEQVEVTNDRGEKVKRWRLGRPYIFYIVANDQLLAPRDDRGLKRHRESMLGYEWTVEKLTDTGYQEVIPNKVNADNCDAERMLHAYNVGTATKRTLDEQRELITPERLKVAENEEVTPSKQMEILAHKEKVAKMIEAVEEYTEEPPKEEELTDDELAEYQELKWLREMAGS